MTIEDRFKKFHEDNPLVYLHFKYYAHQAIAAGMTRLSSKFLIERIRWEAMVVTRSVDFRINNDYTSRYSRMFVMDFPMHAELFETRELQAA